MGWRGMWVCVGAGAAGGARGITRSVASIGSIKAQVNLCVLWNMCGACKASRRRKALGGAIRQKVPDGAKTNNKGRQPVQRQLEVCRASPALERLQACKVPSACLQACKVPSASPGNLKAPAPSHVGGGGRPLWSTWDHGPRAKPWSRTCTHAPPSTHRTVRWVEGVTGL